MKAKLQIAIMATSIASWPVAALAQPDMAVRVIKIGAWAQVLAEKCSQLQVDWQRYGSIMTLAGLRPSDIEPDGRHGKLHRSFIQEALNETKGASATIACASGRSLYGPSGRNMPDLLVPKK